MNLGETMRITRTMFILQLFYKLKSFIIKSRKEITIKKKEKMQ